MAEAYAPDGGCRTGVAVQFAEPLSEPAGRTHRTFQHTREPAVKQYRITARRRQRFLEALAETGNVTLAARAAAVSRTSIYAHRHADDDFERAWLEAEQVAADRLEAEAWRRGVDGVSEPVVSAGRLVTDAAGNPIFVQRYSDQF